MRMLATLLALLVIGACGGDPQPKEPSGPTTSSATPTIAVPTMPAQAKENSPEGAAAFVKHYIDVFNYAANTGDVTELSRLSSPTCEGCQSYIKLYRDTYKAGGYFKDSDWKLDDFEVEQSGSAINVFVRAQAPAGSYKSSEDSTAEPGVAEDSQIVFGAKHLVTWIIVSFDRSKA